MDFALFSTTADVRRERFKKIEDDVLVRKTQNALNPEDGKG